MTSVASDAASGMRPVRGRVWLYQGWRLAVRCHRSWRSSRRGATGRSVTASQWARVGWLPAWVAPSPPVATGGPRCGWKSAGARRRRRPRRRSSRLRKQRQRRRPPPRRSSGWSPKAAATRPRRAALRARGRRARRRATGGWAGVTDLRWAYAHTILGTAGRAAGAGFGGGPGTGPGIISEQQQIVLAVDVGCCEAHGTGVGRKIPQRYQSVSAEEAKIPRKIVDTSQCQLKK
eukprot:371787-Prymnesium_polylepis.1